MRQRSLFDVVESDSTWSPSEPPSLDGIDEIALDFETTGLRWWEDDIPVAAGLGYKRGNEYVTQYLPWAHRGGGNLSEDTVKRWFKREVRNKKIKNLSSKFDNHMGYKWGIDFEEQGCVWGDIAHYAALLDDQRKSGFSLNAVAWDYIQKRKVEGIDVPNISALHAGDARAYGEQDVLLILETMDKMRPLLAAQGLEEVADLEDQVIFPVCEMERNGAPLDVPKLKSWVVKSKEDFLQCIWKIHELTGENIDPSNRNDMVRLFRVLGLPIKKWTSGGATRDPLPSFTDEVLAGLDEPAIEWVRRARRLTSLQDKYLFKYLGELNSDDIIRYSLNQLKADEGGTVSGRFSSSSLMKGEDKTGVNIQQVMRPDRHKETFGNEYIIRELFIPKEGMWFTADARQIEFRLFAHFSNSQRLIEAYEKNPDTDFHNIVWEIVKQFQPDFTRKTTKDTNFAQIYGAGAYKTSQMLKLPMEKAEEFVKIYHEAFPEVKRLLSKASRIASDTGFVKTILGRRFNFPDKQWLHKALSRVIQGSAADVMKRKLVELHKARKRTGFKLRFTVHDEVNGDVPDAKSAEMVKEILNTQSTNFRVPILWETGTGQNWKECKAA